MAVLLALLAALLWGTDDFLGGRLSRRVPAAAVVLWAAVLSCGLSAAVSAVVGTSDGLRAALAWGAAGGVGSAVGAMALYRGLVLGRAAVVAPTAGVVGAAFPVAVGVAGGDRPGVVAWGGIALALVAIWLLSSGTGPGTSRRGALGYGVVAGIGFGWLLTCLGVVPEGSALWPVVASKAAGVALVSLVSVARRSFPRVTRSMWPWLAALAVVDVGAATAYLFAAQLGMLSLVAVLASLYPAQTVVLAGVVGGERPSARQVAGAVVALGGAVLISVSP